MVVRVSCKHLVGVRFSEGARIKLEVNNLAKEAKKAQPPTAEEAVDQKVLSEGPEGPQKLAEEKAKQAAKDSK